MAAAASQLFQPFRVGAIELPNRIVMAPLTRSRAGAGDAVGRLQAEYYRQRATAGLIISEGTFVSPEGKGYIRIPGIFTKAQVEGWKRVTDAVHEEGGRIFAQLWHVGRLSHRAILGGARPVAPSAVAPVGKVLTDEGLLPYETPRALELHEIPRTVELHARGAECAREAGFDGVEIHGANGYLIEQFLKDGTNQRTDEYGGSIANRVRFALEVTRAVVAAWSGDRVGFRISPITAVPDSDAQSVYLHLVRELNRFGLAYLHVREAPGAHGFDFKQLRRAFNGPYMANDSYDLARAEAALAEDRADLIAFGRPFISNPDLVARLRERAPLAEPDRATFYTGEEKGYTDYPTYTAAGPIEGESAIS